jgi:hypothetical protein
LHLVAILAGVQLFGLAGSDDVVVRGRGVSRGTPRASPPA